MTTLTPRNLAFICATSSLETRPHKSINSEQLSKNAANASPRTVHLVGHKMCIPIDSFFVEFRI